MNRPSALRLAVSGMLALAIAIGVGRFAFTPILPMMQKDYGLTLRMAGLLASVNYVGYFIGALSAIWIRMTTATVVRISVVSVALLTGAMGVIHDPVAWLLLRALAGMVSAWIFVFASTYILQQLAMPVLLPGMTGIVISAGCVGGTFMVATMTGMQEARARAPDHASRLMAAMTAAFGMGQISGPLLVSLVADLQNGMNALLIGASLLLLGSAAVLASGATMQRPMRDSLRRRTARPRAGPAIALRQAEWRGAPESAAV